jgi:hypothetical protein
VTELNAVASEDAIELSWLNPSRRVDNSRLRDLTVARVFRSEDPGIGEPRPALRVGDRIVGYREVGTVRFTGPAPALTDRGRLRFSDREGLAFGNRYTYVVVTEDSLGRMSPPSVRVSVPLIAPPAPPAAVAAEPGEAEVRLRWDPPARLVDGGPVTGEIRYEILRALGTDAPLQPVTPIPVAETEFVDRNLVIDRAYSYAVRAIRSDAGATARSAMSARVAATPVDLTPPSPPGNLVVAPTGGAVRMSWNPSPEADVAAYVVYRAGPRGEFVRIGSTRPPTTTFIDRDVTPGTYRYAVTAQDGSARANESQHSNQASVTLP